MCDKDKDGGGNRSKLGTGAIVGIVIAVAVGVVFILKRSKKTTVMNKQLKRKKTIKMVTLNK